MKKDASLNAYLITARIGKKKERATKATNLLKLVISDAVGYRQNFELIHQGERLVKLLEQYRKDLDIL